MDLVPRGGLVIPQTEVTHSLSGVRSLIWKSPEQGNFSPVSRKAPLKPHRRSLHPAQAGFVFIANIDNPRFALSLSFHSIYYPRDDDSLYTHSLCFDPVASYH